MLDAPERFGSLLQEKLDELDAAVAAEAQLRNDPIERLRLHAAHLITGVVGGPWATGATIRFQPDPADARVTPPTFDIQYPAPALRLVP